MIQYALTKNGMNPEADEFSFTSGAHSSTDLSTARKKKSE